jgi:hypothetical protein
VLLLQALPLAQTLMPLLLMPLVPPRREHAPRPGVGPILG